MYTYFARGGPADNQMIFGRFPNGFVLTDMSDELGNGAPWVWIYDTKEILEDTGEKDEAGNPVTIVQGYHFVVRDETGEAFDEELAELAAEGNTYDVIAYDNGEVPEGVEVGQ